MKILSRMLSRKIDPSEAQAPAELSKEIEQPTRRAAPLADDSGEANASQVPQDKAVFASASAPIKAKAEEPEVAGSGWEESDWDDESWDDDEDWGEGEELDVDSRRLTDDKKRLVTEIRDAMEAVSRVRSEGRPEKAAPTAKESDWAADEDFGRQAKARSELANPDNEERILEKTETEMTDRETSRRRSAMAHLKKAAAATKADRVLRHVVSRDPAVNG